MTLKGIIAKSVPISALPSAAVVSLASGMTSLTTNTSSTSNGSAGGGAGGGGGVFCVCGIRFSSATNLEAHRMFYCTHRPTQTGE